MSRITPLGITVPSATDTFDSSIVSINSGADAIDSLIGSKVTKPVVTPTQGQLLSYDAVSGLYIATAPSGSSELAYAENASNTTQTIAANALTDITSCSIVVPVSSRPAYISGQASIFAATAGLVGLQILEVSNGVDPIITTFAAFTMPASAQFFFVVPPIRVGATLRPRTFKLQASSGGAVLTVANSATQRSAVMAEAR